MHVPASQRLDRAASALPDLDRRLITAESERRPTDAQSPKIARVLIVDDHAQVRAGVRAVLATEPMMRVVGEASSGDEALGLALVLRPDLIVLDHEMPGSQGLDVLPKLRVILPDAGIVMFTMGPEISRQARLQGAEAVIAKDDPDALVATLRLLAEAHTRRPLAETPSASRPAGRRLPGLRVLLPGLVLLYFASFALLVAWFGNQAIDIAIVVVAAAGAAYGLRGGLIAAALALPANAVLIDLAGLSVPEAGSAIRVGIALALGAGVGRLRDVSLRARRQARAFADSGAALAASDRRLFGLIEDAPVMLLAIDESGIIVDALGAGFGDHPTFSAERMRGEPAARFLADDEPLLARLGRLSSGEEFSERVDRFGVVYDVRVRPRHDEAGALVGTTAVLVNVSGWVRAEERLARATLHDPVTDLPNRLLLGDRVEQALQANRRSGRGVAVLMLGLDHFKSVNLTYGHTIGDVLLREVARRLGTLLGDGDTIARFSGDEFAIVLATCPPGADVIFAGRIEQVFSEPFSVDGQRVYVSASIGGSSHPQDGSDPETLLRKAEIAMYVAKRSRAGFQPYRGELDERDFGRMALTTELREALQRGGLEIHFQPIVSVPHGEVVMVEALIRWSHSTRGQISPLEFIPLAEETDLMRPLTDWILTEAIGQCRRWLDAGWRVPIAVNLSVRNLADPELAERVRALLAAAAVPASSLTLEITESVVMADAARSLQTMRQLQEVGIELAIDDFGTGYSSLAYLGRLPITAVKIDRTFVGSMLADHSALTIVGATVGLAHALGFRVVAEGVESQAVLELLRTLGSDLAQGYHIARPMPAAALLPWLVARSQSPSSPAA